MGFPVKSAVIVFSLLALTAIADQRQPIWEVEQLKNRIADLQRTIQTGREEETIITEDLNGLEREIVDLNKKIKREKNRLRQIEKQNINLNSELQQLTLENESTQDTLLQMIRSSYMLGRQSSIKLLLNQQNPMEMSRALAFYRYFIASKNRYIQEIRDRRQEINDVSEELRQQQITIDKTLSGLRESQQRLSGKEQARREQLNLVQKKLSEDINQVNIFRKRKEELTYLLNNLQNSSPGSGQIRSDQDQQERTLLTGFQNNKGRLEMPSIAGIKHRFGEKKRESGLIWEGLMLDVQEGQDVSAIYPGQVVYADWFRGYGQLMVLDHGDGFMSLYGHNQLLHVQLGDRVGAGDIIASAGSTGGLLLPGLYFEIRENGNPVNPLEWCRL